MTIAVGIAVNDKKFVFAYHSIKRAKKPFLWRLKQKLAELPVILMGFIMPVYGVA